MLNASLPVLPPPLPAASPQYYTRKGSKPSFSRGDAEDAESYAKGFFRDLSVSA